MNPSSSRARRVVARFRSPLDVILAARILAWACVLPALKHTLPLQTLVRLVRRAPNAAGRDPRHEEQVVTFARWACRLTRWRSGGNCLERGLIAYRYLGAANAEPTLVVGIARDDRSGVRGHAWVLLDGQPAGESVHAISDFAVMLTFTPDGAAVPTQ